MIKYLGSKRLLVPLILDTIGLVRPDGTVVDLFSGTSRVGHALKARGYRVLANDHNAYAVALARCYVQADREKHLERATRLLRELQTLPGRPGYFTETFCERSRFVHPRNGERIDAIREEIRRLALEPELESILLVSLMEAADRVDSTTGVQMAYLKQWAPRALNALELRVPELLPRAASGRGEAHGLDAIEAAPALAGDIAYLDPPYNQHKYLGNYHVWETLVRWDKPETYGVACKRVDTRQRRSAFNSRPGAAPAMRRLIRECACPTLVVSFSNEGFLAREDLEGMLRERGDVVVIERDFPRYVGARIGIHNPAGERVGRVSHLRNKEYLYVASSDADAIGRLRAALAADDTTGAEP
ncbi:MAG: DNA methyltransferase [Deltaproteobacteria bacterium]|nr:MAG: DNA methyltransferase [Deltaproteobacteria bacterium]